MFTFERMSTIHQPLIKSKLPHVGQTIFSTMSALAQKHQAINLSQGFPDFEVAPKLIERVFHHMQNGQNQYAPLQGVLPLREILAAQTQKQHGAAYNIDTEINITAGATQAIATAITASIREGDEVIIFTPAYDCYAPYVELNLGTPIFVKLQHPTYQPDWNQVKKLVNHRTKMIIVNTPHNPSGTIFSEEDLDHLEEITSGSDILILSDEVYEHIVFNGKKHLSLAGRPSLAKRSFIVGSFGKTLHITGWKMGYCLAPENLMKEFRKVHQYMVFSVNTPAQYAIADYLSDRKNFEIASMYQQKRDIFLEAVKNSRFKALSSKGSYFVLLDYGQITQENEVDFAKRLTIEHSVASIPLSVFYNDPTDHKVLRFCFAKQEKTLREAGHILSKV